MGRTYGLAGRGRGRKPKRGRHCVPDREEGIAAKKIERQAWLAGGGGLVCWSDGEGGKIGGTLSAASGTGRQVAERTNFGRRLGEVLNLVGWIHLVKSGGKLACGRVLGLLGKGEGRLGTEAAGCAGRTRAKRFPSCFGAKEQETSLGGEWGKGRFSGFLISF